MTQTWLIVGASRGIGLEFVTQLLAAGHTVIATQRAPAIPTPTPPSSIPIPSKLSALAKGTHGQNLTILECDVSNEESIKRFSIEVGKLGRKGKVLEHGIIDVAVINAGVLDYPNRISELSFSSFIHHINTNTIGPLITASHLLSLSAPPPPTTGAYALQIPISIRTLVFTSSDSGSTTNFRSFEDGFGAYAASKAGLNQGLRHLAAELHRKRMMRDERGDGQGKGEKTVVLAIHPGEVSTDMAANVELGWEVEGVITPEESIKCMLEVIAEKGFGGADEGGSVRAKGDGSGSGREYEDGEASFWTWEGRRYPW